MPIWSKQLSDLALHFPNRVERPRERVIRVASTHGCFAVLDRLAVRIPTHLAQWTPDPRVHRSCRLALCVHRARTPIWSARTTFGGQSGPAARNCRLWSDGRRADRWNRSFSWIDG